MSKKIVELVLLIVFFLGGNTVGLTQRLHPKLKKKEKTLQSVLLIPPKITISRSSVKGSESMLAESEAIEKATQKLVFDTLKAKGFNVIDGQVTSDSSTNNEESRYALADIQGKYGALHTWGGRGENSYAEPGGCPGIRPGRRDCDDDWKSPSRGPCWKGRRLDVELELWCGRRSDRRGPVFLSTIGCCRDGPQKIL